MTAFDVDAEASDFELRDQPGQVQWRVVGPATPLARDESESLELVAAI